MNCPRCKAELERSSIKETSLTYDSHTCTTCEGFLLDLPKLQEIEMQVEQRFFEFRRIPGKEEQQEQLHCPKCEGQVVMDKLTSERDKKVIMDVCPKCKNIWLDGGEVKAIQQDSFATLIVDTVRWLRSEG
jgi:Zn-finger nucleic acid-binding protein